MKKLGMNVEQIEDVQSIVIKTPKGNWVFDSAEVSAMTMQGQTTYQITGRAPVRSSRTVRSRKRMSPWLRHRQTCPKRRQGKPLLQPRRYCRSDHEAGPVMIEAGDRVLLVGEGREFWVKAGPGKLGTDKGQIELESIVGKAGGDIITTHSGAEFTIRIPRPTDFFAYGKRSGPRCCPRTSGLSLPIPA